MPILVSLALLVANFSAFIQTHIAKTTRQLMLIYLQALLGHFTGWQGIKIKHHKECKQLCLSGTKLSLRLNPGQQYSL